MHGATHYLAVLGEDDLYVGLLDDGCVEVANKDSGVEGAWIIFVGHVAGLGFTSHSPPVALLGHRHREGRTGL